MGIKNLQKPSARMRSARIARENPPAAEIKTAINTFDPFATASAAFLVPFILSSILFLVFFFTVKGPSGAPQRHLVPSFSRSYPSCPLDKDSIVKGEGTHHLPSRKRFMKKVIKRMI